MLHQYVLGPYAGFRRVRHHDARTNRRPPEEARRTRLGRRIALAYLLVGGAAIVAYLVVPPFADNFWLFELVGVSPSLAITAGVLLYRPRPTLPWLLFVAAQAVFVAGDICYDIYDLSFPSPADGLYIAYYPIQVVGLLLLVRRRNPGSDRAGLLDALIISVGFGVLSWIYLIEPYARHVDASLMSRIVSMAYPAMDVLLLAVLARLVMGGGTRPRALHLMVASIVCLVLTDAAFAAIELGGSYSVGSWLDTGWMVNYVLWGAAALHPSMRDLAERAPESGTQVSGQRLLLLAAASLIAPAMLLVNSQWPIVGFDVGVAAAASVALFVLVMVRMVGLVASLRDAVGRHERAERRESVLRRAATALAAAPDREHIRSAAVSGARSLVQGLTEVEIDVELHGDVPPRETVGAAAPHVLVVPLATQAAVHGGLVVASDAPVPTDVADGLRTLGAQVALALEGAALTEDLSRQRSDARVGALVQNSTDVIMVLDGELDIRYVTPSVEHVLGHGPADLVGTPLYALVEPSQRDDVIRFHLANRFRESARGEWRMRRGDGRFTHVEAVSTDLLENPSVRGIVVTLRDITERKALEVGLQRQVEELEQLDRIRSEFVATVSHELRTPLTSIVGQLELLGDGDLGALNSDQVRGVEVIRRNSDRLRALIEDLLTLNHVETSALHLNREPTAVAPLLEGVGSQVEAMAAAKPVNLELDCRPGVGSALVDAAQLDRALVNLLTNAVKFTPAGGKVVLRARREGPDLVVTVIDDGLGIPEDEQDRLFTRFFRSSVATRMAIQGTGLGLVIVKQIVEEHGGTVSLVSAPGAGTTVTVRIPAGEECDVRGGAA